MNVDKRVETARRTQAELVQKSLQKGNPVHVSLTRSSMAPCLLPGDELIVEYLAWQQLRAGDIVLYERSEALLAHRLIRVEPQTPDVCLITKGDAAESYDSPVSVDSYLGKVTRAVRRGHVINLEGLSTPAGVRLHIVRSGLKAMMTRLTHIIQERLGIACALVVALALFGASTASAAVTVSSFVANGGRGQIVLSWTTETEMSNWGFNIDRSVDQTNWTHVAFVQSQSPCISNMTPNDYSYTDNGKGLVITATYHYRLELLGSTCRHSEPDQYYERTVSASPNGGKGPAQPTPTPTVQPSPTAVPPTATPTAVPPTATPTAIPPTATATSVPQATSTNTPQPQNTPAPANTPVPTNTSVPLPVRTVPSGAPRFTPTATLAPGAQQPTAAAPVDTQTPAGGEQPASATSTDAPAGDAATASPAPTELALVVATEAPSAQVPQGSRQPVQAQPTPAPAAGGSLLIGLGLLGVLGMGAAGFLLLSLAGVVLWRFYVRG
jgi:signal peptidase I